jgi:hypothetical protein
MKKCGRCKELLDEDSFYVNRRKGSLQSYCKTCAHDRRMEYYNDNKEAEELKKRERERDL